MYKGMSRAGGCPAVDMSFPLRMNDDRTVCVHASLLLAREGTNHISVALSQCKILSPSSDGYKVYVIIDL